MGNSSAGLFMGFRSLTDIFIGKGIGWYYARFDKTECCYFTAYAIGREHDGCNYYNRTNKDGGNIKNDLL